MAKGKEQRKIKKVIKHIEDDTKDFKKQIAEDKELKKSLKGNK